MIAATRPPCPGCGRFNPPERSTCVACGRPLGDAPRAQHAVVHVHGAWVEPRRTTLAYLGLGALLAPVFTFTPLLRYMGWFLGSLCHEIGHVAVAWFGGCPAYPAIRLDGHAVAIHGDQMGALAVLFWLGLAALTWKFRRHRAGLLTFGGGALLYPLFAFTGARELLFLAGGHLGELAFATVFLWRALVGWSRTRPERVLYATCGWYLFGRNAWLCLGLLLSDGVRSWYLTNGSLGLENDYVRLAREVLGVELGVVAFGMLLVTLAAPVTAWLLFFRTVPDPIR